MKIHIVPLGIDNCYALQADRTVWIDGGAPGSASTISDRFQAIGLRPADVALIILTHAHWDHIGAARALTQLTGAKLAVHRNEREIVEHGLKSMPPSATPWGSIFGAVLRAALPFVRIEPAEVGIEISDEGMPLAPYGIDGHVVFTPGHSAGSVSIVLRSGEAFVGDMAMNGLPLRLGPGLPVFAEDIAMVKESWKKLLRLGVKMVYPAHGARFAVTGLERELTGDSNWPTGFRE